MFKNINYINKYKYKINFICSSSDYNKALLPRMIKMRKIKYVFSILFIICLLFKKPFTLKIQL